jgi:Transcriptional regulatory protein, C terminal
VLTIGGLEIRPAELQVFVQGARVNFTVREFETFYALAERCDRVVSRSELYAAVWGGQMPHRDRSVDVFVRKVRRKLAAVSPGWTYKKDLLSKFILYAMGRGQQFGALLDFARIPNVVLKAGRKTVAQFQQG